MVRSPFGKDNHQQQQQPAAAAAVSSPSDNIQSLRELLRSEIEMKETLAQQNEAMQAELAKAKREAADMQLFGEMWMHEKVSVLTKLAKLNDELDVSHERNKELIIEVESLKVHMNSALKAQAEAEQQCQHLYTKVKHQLIVETAELQEKLHESLMEKDELLFTAVEILTLLTRILREGRLPVDTMEAVEIMVYRLAKHFSYRKRHWITDQKCNQSCGGSQQQHHHQHNHNHNHHHHSLHNDNSSSSSNNSNNGSSTSTRTSLGSQQSQQQQQQQKSGPNISPRTSNGGGNGNGSSNNNSNGGKTRGSTGGGIDSGVEIVVDAAELKRREFADTVQDLKGYVDQQGDLQELAWKLDGLNKNVAVLGTPEAAAAAALEAEAQSLANESALSDLRKSIPIPPMTPPRPLAMTGHEALMAAGLAGPYYSSNVWEESPRRRSSFPSSVLSGTASPGSAPVEFFMEGLTTVTTTTTTTTTTSASSSSSSSSSGSGARNGDGRRRGGGETIVSSSWSHSHYAPNNSSNSGNGNLGNYPTGDHSRRPRSGSAGGILDAAAKVRAMLMGNASNNNNNNNSNNKSGHPPPHNGDNHNNNTQRLRQDAWEKQKILSQARKFEQEQQQLRKQREDEEDKEDEEDTEGADLVPPSTSSPTQGGDQ